MSYYLAKSLDATNGLWAQINRMFPNRDRASDGWIGDASHAARPSDHNPDYDDGGIVRATDTDANGAYGAVTPLSIALLKAAIGDFRVWYVIFRGVIYSRTYGFAPRAYNGSNRHDQHVHISLRHNVAENDTRPWDFGLTAPKPEKEPTPVDQRFPKKKIPREIDLDIVMNVFKGYLEDPKGYPKNPRKYIARVQHALNKAGAEPRLEVDGVIGDKTVNEWRQFERANVGTGRPGVPDRRSLRRLIAPVYRITDAKEARK